MKTFDLKGGNPKPRAVRDMFGAIANRYDLLNHVLSGNIDKSWRQACFRAVSKRLGSSNPRVLDVGCGTADLSLIFSKLGPVVGCDFCLPMLRLGRQKIARAVLKNPVILLEGDALALPFAHLSFDIVLSGFVLRNLADIDRGLEEMRRVLRPGGVLGILDFAMPRIPLLGTLYRFYFTRLLPRLGRILSGVDGAYQYLPDSVQEFPSPEVLKDRIAHAGFDRVECHLLTAGVAALFVGSVGGCS